MLRYAGPYLFLGSVPALFYGLGPAAPFLAIAALLTALLGAELIAPRADAAPPSGRPIAFRLLVLGYIPLQIAAVAWGTWLSPQLGPWGFAALACALGVTGGVFGVLAAHDAIHSGDRRESLLGLALLTAMSYRHFRIAHIHGHHRWAGTEKDAATARLNEGFYRFLGRTLRGQFAEAWTFEQRRAGVLRNRVLGDLVMMAAILAGIGALLGARAVCFFLMQSAMAIIVLELFNYIAHYGLARRVDAGGRRERLSERHSWNSSNVLANALIFNMGRHACHHERPAAPFQALTTRAGPELPLGYAGSILLALFPPIWRRVMDPRARVWSA